MVSAIGTCFAPSTWAERGFCHRFGSHLYKDADEYYLPVSRQDHLPMRMLSGLMTDTVFMMHRSRVVTALRTLTLSIH